MFVAVRVLGELAIVLTWIALRWRRFGERWPEQLSLVIVLIPEIAIAWMIPRAGNRLEAYLLGLSLAIYATAFLIVWRWRLTAILVVVTGVAIAVSRSVPLRVSILPRSPRPPSTSSPPPLWPSPRRCTGSARAGSST